MTRAAPTPLRARMGPLTAAELATLGIVSVERVVALGWREVFARWVEAYPHRLNANAAVGLIAVVEGISWMRVPAARRAHAREVVDALRRAMGLAPTRRPRPRRQRARSSDSERDGKGRGRY
jgi:uncharacterized protein YjeT (DUF2065 family)